jgi:hypothetical protein
MTPEADPATIQWPCRLPADLSQALEAIQADMRSDKSKTVRYIVQLGIEQWNLRAREVERLESLAAQGMTMASILPFLGSPPPSTASARIKKDRGDW